MAYKTTCEVYIGNLFFTTDKNASYINEISVESGWDNFGDKATIKLANLARFEGKNVKLQDLLKTGEKVAISLGYDNNNILEFEGYIAEIKPKIPFEIVCEDETYNLKRSKAITASYTNISLEALIKTHLPEVTLDSKTPQITLENLRVRNVTKAELLQELKEKYLLAVYYRRGKLYVGLPYFDKIGSAPVLYDFQKNIISDNLAYRRKEDVKIKAKAYSINKGGTRIEVEVGDKDGEVRTLPYQNITSKEVLEQQATLDLEKLRFEGYQGDFVAFGAPYIEHSDSVLLTDNRYPQREGRYLVDKVKTVWGVRGFRRTITLGKKYD